MDHHSSRERKGFVAVIDDDPEILDAVQVLLEVEGYQCQTYPSATHYLESRGSAVLPKDTPYCILSDVMMPGIDGLALQQEMNDQGVFQIVLMSGAAGSRDVSQAFRSGVVDFLTKPFEDVELLKVIEKAHAAWVQRHERLNREGDLQRRLKSLTKRELQVVKLVAQGDTNQMVADKLFIVLRTVKLHRQRAMEKLGCQRVVDLPRVLDDALENAEVISLRDEAKKWEDAAMRDPLTSALNRRGLEKAATAFLAKSAPGSVAMVDIDYFKQVNDTFGHAVGDRVLVVLANLLATQSRDLVVRMGGEEFGVLLPDTTPRDALRICERIRVNVQGYDWNLVQPTLKITISVGVADRTSEKDINVLVDRADQALYRAKREGRNRVVST